jgi:hypothetical protein
MSKNTFGEYSICSNSNRALNFILYLRSGLIDGDDCLLVSTASGSKSNLLPEVEERTMKQRFFNQP